MGTLVVTERDREMYKSAIDRARKMRIMADYPSDFMEYEEREIIATIAAAREDGRRAAIEEVLAVLDDEGSLGHTLDRVRNLLTQKKPL